jgi:hypothetical protein
VEIGMSSAFALILIGLGIASRLLPHPPGFVAMGAIAVYAGARLPRLWALAVPLLALVVSDFVLVHGGRWSDTFAAPVDLVRYATFAAIALAAFRWGRGRQGVAVRLGQGAAATLLFWVTSNLAVWAFPYGLPGEPGHYPRTLAGLGQCFLAALPFLDRYNFLLNGLAADLLGVGVLFGLDALAHRHGLRGEARAAA